MGTNLKNRTAPIGWQSGANQADRIIYGKLDDTLSTEGKYRMDISIKTAISAAVIICFGISFFSFKIIPTKRQILYLSDDKEIKLLKVGSAFFGLGLLILAIDFILGLVH
jgi:hypothetical protein